MTTTNIICEVCKYNCWKVYDDTFPPLPFYLIPLVENEYGENVYCDYCFTKQRLEELRKEISLLNEFLNHIDPYGEKYDEYYLSIL